MDEISEGLTAYLPVDGDMVVQRASHMFGRVASNEVRLSAVLPLVIARNTDEEIRKRIPGLRDRGLQRARRIFRAKFTKATGYHGLPHTIALCDENVPYDFAEILRDFTGVSTNAMAENILSTPDPDIYQRATQRGIDFIFTRDMRIESNEDLSWHADHALRRTIKSYSGFNQSFPHFPLIVQISRDIRELEDFWTCLERDILSLYYIRFGLLASICRINLNGLRFVKAFTDYPLPDAIRTPNLTAERHIKTWLDMAFRQSKLPTLEHEHQCAIKAMARSIRKTPAQVWRQPLNQSLNGLGKCNIPCA